MGNKLRLEGLVFGRLTVLYEDATQYNRSHWKCQCECGNTKTICGNSLRRGLVKSCGCLRKELVSSKMKTHGLSKTAFYGSWSNMITRTTNPLNEYQTKTTKITVCERWLSFTNFKEDMYQSYLDHLEIHGKKNTTIDRKDNTKGYSPDNCRWATKAIQRSNQNYSINQRLFQAVNLSSGEVFFSKNQREFARQFDLKQSGIWLALTKKIAYKGWRFRYVKEELYENKICKRLDIPARRDPLRYNS